MASFTNLQVYNMIVDRTMDIAGDNNILYRYYLPYGANPQKYYEDAIYVQSIKSGPDRPSTSKQNPGYHYKNGQIQPIGDRRYFTYYQLNNMTPEELWDFFIELYLKEKLKEYINYLEKRGL